MQVDEKSRDAELVRQTLAGDNKAFNLLTLRHEARLISYAFNKMGNREDAEDVVQETFTEAFLSLRNLDEPVKFTGWLYVIASRLITKHYRKRQKQVEVISFSDLGDEAAAFEIAATHAHRRAERFAEIGDLQGQLKIAIDRLPESLREPMRLRITDMNYREIAQTLGITENAVKRRLARARIKLKALLKALVDRTTLDLS